MGDAGLFRAFELEAVEFSTALDDQIDFRAAVGAPEKDFVRLKAEDGAKLLQGEAFP